MAHGVIFDMDGVLVDSGPPHLESWQILARKHDLPLTDEQFQRCFGQTSRDIVRLLWGAAASDADVSRLDAEKEAIYRDLIRAHVPLMPGCRALLERLRTAGLRLAVATSGPPENLELVLTEGLIANYFDAEVHGFDVTRGKPAPDCFLLAAARLSLLPGDCVVVEDAPVGIRAAVAAGMPVIALAGTHPEETLRAAGAVDVVRALDQITPGQVRARLLRT